MDTYEKVYERDLLEANKEIIISSPGLNQAKVNVFVRIIRQRQEDGVKITVATLDPEVKGFWRKLFKGKQVLTTRDQIVNIRLLGPLKIDLTNGYIYE